MEKSVNKITNEKKVLKMISIDKKTYMYLKEVSEKDDRSVNSLISKIIKEWINKK